LKKKLFRAPASDEEIAIRTEADYETLRRFITEGGEIHSRIEQELSVFITNGVAAWIRLCRDENDTEQAKWPVTPHQRHFAQILTILLANMMES